VRLYCIEKAEDLIIRRGHASESREEMWDNVNSTFIPEKFSASLIMNRNILF
jgi:hypothetical protein